MYDITIRLQDAANGDPRSILDWASQRLRGRGCMAFVSYELKDENLINFIRIGPNPPPKDNYVEFETRVPSKPLRQEEGRVNALKDSFRANPAYATYFEMLDAFRVGGALGAWRSLPGGSRLLTSTLRATGREDFTYDEHVVWGIAAALIHDAVTGSESLPSFQKHLLTLVAQGVPVSYLAQVLYPEAREDDALTRIRKLIQSIERDHGSESSGDRKPIFDAVRAVLLPEGVTDAVDARLRELGLTEAQLEVARSYLAGLGNEAIAERLLELGLARGRHTPERIAKTLSSLNGRITRLTPTPPVVGAPRPANSAGALLVGFAAGLVNRAV